MSTDKTIRSGDSYIDALRKHIPGGILGAYITCEGIISPIQDDGAKMGISWAVFAACLVYIPLWMIFADKNKDWLQILFAGLSFIILVLTMGGPFGRTFEDPNGIIPAVGGILAVLFTGIIGPLVLKARA